MTRTTPAIRSAGPAQDRHPRVRPGPVPGVVAPGVAARLISVLHDHPCWSVFWDKAYRVWRVADDDPDSELYTESSDADTVIAYIQAHA
jgi:hypothetical protein